MTEPRPNGELVRIEFKLDPDDWHGTAIERLWAEPAGDSLYRLRNSPFFVFGVSAEDVVSATPIGVGLRFAEVVARGGHSTYRISKPREADMPAFEQYWAPLQNLGCSYEGGRVFAVDVPAKADIYEAYRLLEAGEQAGVWDFEEAHCGHAVG